MILPQPNPAQMPLAMYRGRKAALLINRSVLLPPKNAIIVLNNPSLDANVVINPQITTMDTKCGRYVTVCTTFLNLEFSTSFKSNAKIIGAGNPNARFKRLMISVLDNVRKKNILEKKL